MKNSKARIGDDPLERMIAEALDGAGIRYLTDYEGKSPAHLDFFLPDHDVYVEVKGGHTPRVADQMARHHNVIVVQGQRSVALFCDLLRK